MGLFDWMKKNKTEDEEKETEEVLTQTAEEADAALPENEKEADETEELTETAQPERKTEQEETTTPQDTEPESSEIVEEAQEEVAETEPEKEEQPEEKKKGFFQKLVSGLTKTRNSIADSFSSVFAANHIDEDFYEELEEILIMADMGVSTTMNILDELREQVKKQHIKEPKDCKELLVSIIKEQMSPEPNAYEYENKTSVVMVIGVNGVGKTTSVGKLAGKLKDQGKKVILAAADTFRAAAGEQLTEWANRAGVEIIGGQAGADPASVIYDAVAAAKARNADVLLCDTAGRLHNKKNLMEELRKIYRILEREYPDAYLETLVVLDGTTGQNALAQARQFAEVANVSGIILTKLDGTAKGGIAVAIQSELDIPVKYIGVGESIDDLQKFDADAFVNALFDVDHKENPDAQD